MDLAPPGRAAAAATCGVAARADHPIPVCVGEFGPVDHDRYPYARARPAAAAATAVADFFLRLANPGAGWSRGWTSGCRGERPRPMGSPRDRRAVAHSGWGSQACSLSVDVVQRQRHAAMFFFANGGRRRRRWSSRMDLAPPGRAAAAATCGVAARADHPIPVCVGEFGPVDHDRYPYARARPAAAAATAVADFFLRLANPGPAGAGDGPRAAGASGRDLWGRRAIAGLLRTAAGGLRRALYPLTWCSGSGTRRILFREWRPAPAAMELEDGPRAAGASGRGGHLRGRGSSRPSNSCLRWRIRPR